MDEELKEYILSNDKNYIIAMHLRANAFFDWKDGVTDNYSGDPIYDDNKNVISVEPFMHDGQYSFPLLGYQDKFLEAGVISISDLVN